MATTRLISENKALEVLDNYFGKLAVTGYETHASTMRMLMYLFLLDFVGCCAEYITDDDYVLAEKALKRLLRDGGCLLPYPVYATNRASVGRDSYMGDSIFRICEDGDTYRLTEGGSYRSVEPLTMR